MSEISIPGCLEDPNPVQLELIREIHEALTARSIPHWLGGGWALDFLLGELQSFLSLRNRRWKPIYKL